MADPKGRTLPPPVKNKRKGHEAPTATEAAPDTPAQVLDLRPSAPGPEPPAPKSTSAKRSTSTPPDVAGAVRTTVYSDARIEDYLRDVGVEALMARLDVTKAAVWRWAMTELMERYRPAEVVEHFRTAAREGGRVGRPRR
jgi:hypothetical protein